MKVLFLCSPIYEKALLSGRFPGFASLPFWYERRVDEDEHGAWWNDVDRGKPK